MSDQSRLQGPLRQALPSVALDLPDALHAESGSTTTEKKNATAGERHLVDDDERIMPRSRWSGTYLMNQGG